jgi:hypothetical protein
MCLITALPKTGRWFFCRLQKNDFTMKIVVLLSLLFFNLTLLGQAPGIEWQNTIGGSKNDGVSSIQQTNDGGYIIGGSSISNISGDKTENNIDTVCNPECTTDYWVVKTDAAGNIQWQNTTGGNDYDNFCCIQQTADGGYIIGGSSSSSISGDKTENYIGLTAYDDYWIIKTDATGNIQWQNVIGGDFTDVLSSIQQTADGGYILGGSSNSDISGDKTENSWYNLGGLPSSDYWIVKIDSIGNIQWQNTIGGWDDDGVSSIDQTVDGGYILGGSSSSDISGDKTEDTNGYPDYWIVKIDSLGSILWQNTIGGNNWETLYCIRQINDGGYVLGGQSNSSTSGDKTEDSNGGYDYWIIKTDATGNIQWQNTIGGSADDWLYDIQQTSGGGYILAGMSGSGISGDKTENNTGLIDYWIVKADTAGYIQWQNTIGGNKSDYLFSIQQTADSGYILGGYSASDISGDKTEDSWNDDLGYNTFDYWIVKLSQEIGIEDVVVDMVYNIFPNPFTTSATITINQPGNFDFMLYNLFGQQVRRAENISDQYILERSNLPAGVYFYKVEEDGKMMGSGKVVCLQ